MAFVGAAHPAYTFTREEVNPIVVPLETAAVNFVSKVDDITRALAPESEDDRVPLEALLTYEFAGDFNNHLTSYVTLFSEFIDRDLVRMQTTVTNIVENLQQVVAAEELAAAQPSEE